MSTDFTTKPSTRQRGPSGPSGPSAPSIPLAMIPHTAPENTFKWPKQQEQLCDMGFDSEAVIDALERAAGRMDVATAILCDTTSQQQQPKPPPAPVGIPAPVAWGSNTTNPALWRNVSSGSNSSSGALRGSATGPTTTSNATTTSAAPASSTLPVPPTALPAAAAAAAPAAPVPNPSLTKAEAVEAKHVRFMSTFKVQRCRKQLEKQPNHDKRSCLFYHGRSDRRRNPYLIEYSCSECTDNSESSPCPDGDACLKAHNMLERMFHPDLFKISMCQKPHSCERAHLCAFAHSSDDHRTAPPKTANLAYDKASTSVSASVSNFAVQQTQAQVQTQILPQPAPSALYGSESPASTAAATGSTKIAAAVAPVAGDLKAASTSTSSAVIAMLLGGEHPALLATQQRLIDLIRMSGEEGIISSEVPKRYEMHYGEKLELEAMSAGSVEKIKMKDLVLTQPGVTVSMHKGVQPRYVYDVQQAEEDKALLRQQEQQLQDKMQAAMARAVGQAASTRPAPAPAPVAFSQEARTLSSASSPLTTTASSAPAAVVVAPSTRRRPGSGPPAIAMSNAPAAMQVLSSIQPIGSSNSISTGLGNTFSTLSIQQRSGQTQSLGGYNRSRSDSLNEQFGGIGLGSSSHATSGRVSPSMSASEYEFTDDHGGLSSLLSGLGFDERDDSNGMQQYGDHVQGQGGYPSYMRGGDGLDSLGDLSTTSSSRISPATLGGMAGAPSPSTRRRGPDIPMGAVNMPQGLPPGLPQLSQHNPYLSHVDNDDQDEEIDAREYNESYDASMMSNPYAQDLAKEALADAEQTIQQLQSEMFMSNRQAAADKLEIGVLKLQVQELQTAKAAADAAKEAVLHEWRSLSHELTALQKQNAEKDTELTARRAAHRDVEVESKRLQQEASTMTTELTAVRKKLTQLEPEFEQAKKKITGLTTDNKRLDTKLKEEEKARQTDAKAHKKKDEEVAKELSKLKQDKVEMVSDYTKKVEKYFSDMNQLALELQNSSKLIGAAQKELGDAQLLLTNVQEEKSRLSKENKIMNTKLQAFQKMLNHNTQTQTQTQAQTQPTNSITSTATQNFTPAIAAASVPPAPSATNRNSNREQVGSSSSLPPNVAAIMADIQNDDHEGPGDARAEKKQKGCTENKDQASEIQEAPKKQSLPPKAQCDLEGCTQAGLFICGSCKSVGYCGLPHQKEHWRFHRKACVHICENIKRNQAKEMIRSMNYADGYAMGQAVGALLDAHGGL